MNILRFEAMGFIKTRKDTARLEETEHSLALAWSEVATYARTLGLHDLESIDRSEDDGQGSIEIKCFVSLTFRGTSNFQENTPASTALAAVMDRLAQVVCCDSAKEWVLIPSDWEVAECYALDNAA
jgi:hypothetical protein